MIYAITCITVLLSAITALGRVIAPAYTPQPLQPRIEAQRLSFSISEAPDYTDALRVVAEADALIAAGENYHANEVISDWVIANVDKMDMYLGELFFSRYDLAITVGGVVALQELIALIDLLTPAQKADMMPILIQLKTRYDLLKRDGDPELLLDIPNTYIPVVQIPITDIPIHRIGDKFIAYLNIDHLLLDLSQLGPDIIKIVRINGVEFRVTVVNSLNVINFNVNHLSLDLSSIPPNVIKILDIDGVSIPFSLINNKPTLYFLESHLSLDLSSIPKEVITYIKINGMNIPLIILNGLVYIDVSRFDLDINWSTLPPNVVVITRISTPVLKLIKAFESKYLETLSLMGEYGLVIPDSITYMGQRWVILKTKILSKGNNWIDDDEIILEWDNYWQDMKRILDAKTAYKNKKE